MKTYTIKSEHKDNFLAYCSSNNIEPVICEDIDWGQTGLDKFLIAYDVPDEAVIDINYLRRNERIGIQYRPNKRTYELIEDNIDDVKSEKKAQISKKADAIHISPISYDNKLLDADATAQQNISGKITELKNDIDLNITSTNLFWKDADNVIHTWNTPAEYLTWLQGLFNAITTRRTNLYALSWQGKAAIDAMTTINSINEYDINTLFNV